MIMKGPAVRTRGLVREWLLGLALGLAKHAMLALPRPDDTDAPVGAPGRAQSPGVSQRTPMGGTVMVAEAGRPCQGSGTASTPPRLPTPLPP
jgi:hypothetical protein